MNDLTLTEDVLKVLAAWCSAERDKLGGVDGYDYRSGEEFGIRRVEIQIEKVLAIAARGKTSQPRQNTLRYWIEHAHGDLGAASSSLSSKDSQ